MPPTIMPDILPNSPEHNYETKTRKHPRNGFEMTSGVQKQPYISPAENFISELSVVRMLQMIEGLEAYRKHHKGLLGVGAES